MILSIYYGSKHWNYMCHCTVKPESNIKSCVHLMHFDKVFKKKKMAIQWFCAFWFCPCLGTLGLPLLLSVSLHSVLVKEGKRMMIKLMMNQYLTVLLKTTMQRTLIHSRDDSWGSFFTISWPWTRHDLDIRWIWVRCGDGLYCSSEPAASGFERSEQEWWLAVL